MKIDYKTIAKEFFKHTLAIIGGLMCLAGVVTLVLPFATQGKKIETKWNFEGKPIEWKVTTIYDQGYPECIIIGSILVATGSPLIVGSEVILYKKWKKKGDLNAK